MRPVLPGRERVTADRSLEILDVELHSVTGMGPWVISLGERMSKAFVGGKRVKWSFG